MPTRSSVRVTALTLVSLTSGIALAQPPAPPSPAAAWGQSAANISGMVRSFELTPAGDLEGFILADGTEVHLPPHLTQQLAGAVHVDDRVEVRGWRSTVPNFVVGTSVTNIGSGQTVVDQGPPPPGVVPASITAWSAGVRGSVGASARPGAARSARTCGRHQWGSA